MNQKHIVFISSQSNIKLLPLLPAHLDSGLREVDLHGDLLPGVDVGVVSLLEGSLQLLQLGRGEGGPDPPLLPLLCEDPVLAGVHLVRQP